MKTIKRLGRLLLIAAFGLSALSVSQTFAASNVQGYITGQVTSSDGNGVSATVTVRNANTGLTRTITADAEGEFTVTSLPVGTYEVSAEYQGESASRTVGVSIGTGTDVGLVLGDAAELSEVTVQGARISPIDISSSESATILGEQTIDRLPVGRNLSSVALLAPGTTRGDTDFGSSNGTVASFGGATVGENVCYINGLNVTNFRNGLGCSTVPFEFYQEFNLKTGGYSAEFGRATGGAIAAVTKSGTNEYKYSVNFFYSPFIDGISGYQPDVKRPFTTETVTDPVSGTDYETVVVDGQTRVAFNSKDESEAWNLSLSASGPIVKDKAFFYVLYNPRDRQFDQYSWLSESYLDRQDDSAFYGLKLDWYLTQNHTLELTAFRDETELTTRSFDYDPIADQVDRSSAATGALLQVRGGDNAILKYTGYLTPDFTLSASYGMNKYKLSDTVTTADIPLVFDQRTSEVVQNPLGGGPYGADEDEREQIRVDGEWFIGDHQLRFGIDKEENTSNQDVQYSGGAFYEIISNTEFIKQVYRSAGEFQTNTDSIYIEDKWQVTDDLTLNLGIRNTTFENTNGQGVPFLEVDNQIAPRLGFSWDPTGDGTSKIFGTYGRYFLPVPSNTNIRLTGGEEFTEFFYSWDGSFQPDGTPTEGTLNSTNVISAGFVPDPRTVVDQEIDPMYQDEIILGYLKELESGWTLGGRFIRRDLKSTIEDITIDAALEEQIPGICADPVFPGCYYYVLTNPGDDVTVIADTNFNGVVDAGETEQTFAGDSLGYPESERYYNSVEFLFERVWDGEWFLQGSYTWSQSYGNNEGFVRTDNDQNDAGLTTLYDFPGLLDGAYGYLPNDRRHALKVFGAWQFAPQWQAGMNLLMESGRPQNAFGNHPSDFFAGLYGHESFYAGGNPSPRGSWGNLPFTSSIDLSLKYFTKISGADVTFGVDLFNVFNATNAIERQEIIERNLNIVTLVFDGPQAGPADLDYGLGERFQAPRAIRLSAQFDF